ncbi:hypothetical protein [Siphonobacter sp. SORGH_AS_0500]|uniref:ATP-grasp domain-containing protein n=1 Tax=Siphonobacter sp. SORGH_AS_0500 TaxID=1864824 RepID=UPI002855E674|nr:hypothetical protein [Siphonobacter sp. SORGH_AS_0500]MDR6195677.1 glutathione synthase/RimK-type ligase-like ATP-grasp enzyme [Siphonobacter sp. SORGH_AS_0500]
MDNKFKTYTTQVFLTQNYLLEYILKVDFGIDQVGGLPAVGKFPRGSQGKQVFILESPQAANTALQAFYSYGQSVIIQEFIEAGGKDIRAIVVGNKVVSAMERTGKKDFRANLSQGGSGRNVLAELTLQEKAFCVEAAKACGLEFAGIDFIRNKEGQPLLIEANGNPGEKIIDVTGHDHYEDLLDLIERKIKPGNGAMPTPAVVQPSAAAMAKIESSGLVMTTSSVSAAKPNPFAGYDSQIQVKLEGIQKKLNAKESLKPDETVLW